MIRTYTTFRWVILSITYQEPDEIALSSQSIDNSLREKLDLAYKDAIDIPFENVKDRCGKYEVKIKIENNKSLVGYIIDEEGWVQNFDILVKIDDENTDNYWNIEIDGATYFCNSYLNSNGDWGFYMDNPTGDAVDTRLAKAEKINKQDELVLKTDSRFDLEKTLENAMFEFIKNDRFKNISDNPKTYFSYFYFVI
ncbi:hypothetical protein M9Y10_019846 [Tritrichomonas musculus]|uniref:Uncharacterized protein n=1 Tax=Tritrichomonas musculus TaxID=1915356 RepID=A0ABR2HHF2_9EUKA